MNATDAVMQVLAEEGLLAEVPLRQELRLQQRITVALAAQAQTPKLDEYQRAAQGCTASATDLRAFVEGAGITLDAAVRLSTIGITREQFENWKKIARA